MKIPRFIPALVVALFALPFLANAQAGGGPGGPNSELDPIFMSLLAEMKGFSADSVITLSERRSKKTTTLEARYEYADGKMRVGIDLRKMKSPDMDAEAISQLSTLGMDNMITLSQVSKGTTMVIYPALKAYAEIQNPALAAVPNKGSEGKVELKEMGQETIEGRVCTKAKAMVQGKGNKLEALIWRAKDLGLFPVQVRIDDGTTQTTMIFRNIKLESPAADRLQPPSGYKAYRSVPELMQAEMMKRMGGMN